MAKSVGEGAMFIIIEKDLVEHTKNKITIGVYSNGELLETVKTNFLGPIS